MAVKTRARERTRNDWKYEINVGIIEYVIDRVPRKYQTSDGVSNIGLACVVAKDYKLDLAEEEAFARHLF